MEVLSNWFEKIVEEIPGFTPVDQLIALHTLAVTTSSLAGDIVEIGSWCGRSTCVLANAVKQSNGVVHAVDLFPDKKDWFQNDDGSYSFSVLEGKKTTDAYTDQTIWEDAFNEHVKPIYEKFDSVFAAFEFHLGNQGLIDFVMPYKGTALDYQIKKEGALTARMAFIDGDHSYEAVLEDIRAIDKILVSGGWIVFDDAFSGFDGVDQAIEKLIIGSDDFELCHQITRKLFVAKKK